MSELSWQSLHYGDRLRVVNPRGDVGLITLWTTPELVLARLREIDGSLFDPATSRVAVAGNLFGDGMYAMLCNLLYNPQVTTLMACGQDLGLPTCDEIAAFIERGVEEAELQGQDVLRIRGTARLLPRDARFDHKTLRSRLGFHSFGNFSSHETAAAVVDALRSLPTRTVGSMARTEVHLPEPAPGVAMISDLSAHTVSRRSPLEVWKELLVRTQRFGRDVVLGGGPRRELLDVKAVIHEPVDDDPEVLDRFGFDLEEFRLYQRRILDPISPSDISYTYGNRLRGHFGQPAGGFDSLATAIEALRADLTTRRAYITLWDQSGDSDLPSPPCLTTVFFRSGPRGLNLTATYRAHNLLSGWLQNVYGLMAVQRYVCDSLDVSPGSLTVISHSLSIDPRSSKAGLAEVVEAGWKRDDDFDEHTRRYRLREDPNGHFIISVDEAARQIVAEHWNEGILLHRFSARRADMVGRQIAGMMSISLPSHALWVGQELVRKELELKRLEETDPRPSAPVD